MTFFLQVIFFTTQWFRKQRQLRGQSHLQPRCQHQLWRRLPTDYSPSPEDHKIILELFQVRGVRFKWLYILDVIHQGTDGAAFICITVQV